MSCANFLAGIEGIPQGTTHIMLRAFNVGFSYSCSVALIKLCDGVWYMHERDSDGEYPAFVKASHAWVAANEKFFIDIRKVELERTVVGRAGLEHQAAIGRNDEQAGMGVGCEHK